MAYASKNLRQFKELFITVDEHRYKRAGRHGAPNRSNKDRSCTIENSTSDKIIDFVLWTCWHHHIELVRFYTISQSSQWEGVVFRGHPITAELAPERSTFVPGVRCKKYQLLVQRSMAPHIGVEGPNIYSSSRAFFAVRSIRRPPQHLLNRFVILHCFQDAQEFVCSPCCSQNRMSGLISKAPMPPWGLLTLHKRSWGMSFLWNCLRYPCLSYFSFCNCDMCITWGRFILHGIPARCALYLFHMIYCLTLCAY